MKTKAQIDHAEVIFFKSLQELIGSPSKRLIVLPKILNKICGVDAAYSREGNRVEAVAVVLSDGEISETGVYSGRFTFPYVSGLFFLHEGPFVTAAVRQLSAVPDLICFDAHGLAHPRSTGLATICGMMLQIPSIGLAKSLLIGEVQTCRERLSELNYQRRKVGFASSSPRRYWSPGYAVSIDRLQSIILQYGESCLRSLSEAHRIARKLISSSKFEKES